MLIERWSWFGRRSCGPQVVWKTVRDDLPRLKDAVLRALNAPQQTRRVRRRADAPCGHCQVEHNLYDFQARSTNASSGNGWMSWSRLRPHLAKITAEGLSLGFFSLLANSGNAEKMSATDCGSGGGRRWRGDLSSM
jgi:hypothetical protein